MALTKTSAEQIKRYDFGERYCLCLSKIAVSISDTEKEKTIVIPLQRFATLLEIQENLFKLRDAEFLQYQRHVGGGWFVSITSGFPCVDIRRFYMTSTPIDLKEKATKSGLAIRLREWINFVAAIHAMKAENPQLAEIQPCGIHPNQEETMRCAECNPYPNVTCVFNIMCSSTDYHQKTDDQRGCDSQQIVIDLRGAYAKLKNC